MDKKAMYNLLYGLYALSARDGRDNLCIINTPVQVTSGPNRVAMAVINRNLTCEMVKNTGAFNLSVLSEDAPFSLFQNFGLQSGRDADKLAAFSDVTRAPNGLLRLNRYANAFISGRVTDSTDLGTHTLFIAEVTDGEVLSALPTMSYAYYQAHVKPSAAPRVRGWRCTVCGYVYEGETLPDGFVCPLCNHGAEDFEPIG